jgi:CheY-like chemotaxis protein
MKKQILIVDDDRQILRSLAKVLQGDGYRVVLAADGQEALQTLRSEDIDLVLLDLNLPLRNGWDTFERMTHFNPLLPIIVITGSENQFDLAAAAGARAFMEKPLDVPLLLQTIGEVLAKHSQTCLRGVLGCRNGPRHAPAWDAK